MGVGPRPASILKGDTARRRFIGGGRGRFFRGPRASGKTLASSLRADTRATADRGSKLGLIRATAAERGVSKLSLELPQLKRLWVALELPQLKEGCD